MTYPSGLRGYYYNPLIWGASYGSGFAASGTWSEFEWAVELKNSALMSRPELWSVDDNGFDNPTITGRLAWRPDLRWTFGVSASKGSYSGTDDSFQNPDDFEQRLILIDLSYEYRHLQIWAEAAWSSFSTPRLEDDLKVFSWFIEARYKLTPRLSMAMRWNDQRYSTIYNDGYAIGKWGDDLQRMDFAVTWRFNAHMQFQAQVDHYWSEHSDNNRFVFSARLTLRF